MERKFLFNYDALNNYLNEQQKNPDWTDGELTMFRNNCKKHLSWDSKNYTITINDETLDLIINGQEGLEDIFQTLPTGYEMSNKSRLYRQVLYALEEAKKYEIFDKVFKQIN